MTRAGEPAIHAMGAPAREKRRHTGGERPFILILAVGRSFYPGSQAANAHASSLSEVILLYRRNVSVAYLIIGAFVRVKKKWSKKTVGTRSKIQ